MEIDQNDEDETLHLKAKIKVLEEYLTISFNEIYRLNQQIGVLKLKTISFSKERLN